MSDDASPGDRPCARIRGDRARQVQGLVDAPRRSARPVAAGLLAVDAGRWTCWCCPGRRRWRRHPRRGGRSRLPAAAGAGDRAGRRAGRRRDRRAGTRSRSSSWPSRPAWSCCPAEELEPLAASSFGTGELIAAALDQGCTPDRAGRRRQRQHRRRRRACCRRSARGSWTTTGDELPLGGGALAQADEVDLSELDWRLDGVEFVLASDVDNPLLGPRGAAAVYGPQKGATPDDVGGWTVRRLGAVVWPDAMRPGTGRDIAGAGAAGGVGFAALARAAARPPGPGIDVVLDLIDFDDAARRRAAGHHRRGLARRADPARQGAGRGGRRGRAPPGVPVVAVSGGRDLDDDRLHAAGVRRGVRADRHRARRAASASTTPVPLLERLGRLIAEDAQRTDRDTAAGEFARFRKEVKRA